jgi:hypothetical protein
MSDNGPTQAEFRITGDSTRITGKAGQRVRE